MLFCIVLIVVLGFLPSCSKTHTNAPSLDVGTSTSPRYSFKDFNKDQALYNLADSNPLPVGFKQQAVCSSTNPADKKITDLTRYLGQQKIDRVVKFYEQEMERLGWKVRNFSVTDEGLLVCTKMNNQRCIVARHNTDRKTKNSYRTALLIFSKQQSS
jgi:hypothetical protein